MTRTRLRILASLGVVAACCAVPHVAGAQDGTSEFAHSDVLLLLDTSGSMARTTVRDPGDPATYGLPQCGTYPASNAMSFESSASFASGPTPADRWAILVKAFTGTIQNPQCAAQDRSDPDFLDEFALGATPAAGERPYDKGYYLPFNRIVASDGTNRCTPAPSWDSTVRSKLVANALKWPSKDSPMEAEVSPSVHWRDMSDPYNPGSECPFVPQYDDGIIDRLKSTVRFGLMTFDPKPYGLSGASAFIGTGVGTFAPVYPEGIADMWSYFPDWLTSTGSATTGWLIGCESPPVNPLNFYEVGARNPAAPPWEGRLISFGDPDASIDQIINNNDRVQQAVLAMRPFGGTPIAGMLSDAVYFLTEDETTPSNIGGAGFFGGKADPVVWSTDRTKRGCRQRIAILITDGGPNLDLQPHCVGGKCPYNTPQASAEELYDKNVDLFVVGFSVTTTNSTGTTLTCKELMDPVDSNFRACSELTACTTTSCSANSCAYGYCVTNPADELLAVCCNLDSIAKAGSGGTREAFWAETGDALVSTVTSILKFPPSAMTRTQPIFATGNLSASNPLGDIDGARFFSSFDPISDNLYAGHLVRERYSCSDSTTPGVAKEQAITETDGDYFELNLDSALSDRNIYTVVAEATSGVIESARSVRPGYVLAGDDPDGLGEVDGTVVSGNPSTFSTNVDPGALLGGKVCTNAFDPCCPPINPTSPPTAEACRTRYLRLQLGFDDPVDTESSYSRTSGFGAMINSTPELVMPPSEHLRDVSYEAFQALFSKRPPMIYAATADGQLHAFAVNETTKKLNELWSFMPPAVLPAIGSQFPTRYAAANRTLLSGPIVVGEVAGAKANDTAVKGRFLTRKAPSPTDADAAQWYTVLLGTFGSSQGYFALDVTNPDPVASTSEPKPAHYANGPRFLWQLTTDADGNPLFGSRSTRPAIATLYFRMTSTEDAAQHAVAILPGGYGGVPGTTEIAETYSDTRVKLGVTPRVDIRQYSPQYDSSMSETVSKMFLGGARSLTIVRLDTGEVIRTFRRPDAGGAATYVAANPEAPESLYVKGRVTPANFSAPITGHIVSYPNAAGTVADRAYVGDAEGRLWRIDLSSVDPSDWSADLFHDAYPAAGPGALGFTMLDVSPLETPPIISTDPVGRVTINISTGEQTMLKSGGRNSVWSLTERRNDDGRILAHVNWVLDGSNAKNMGGTGDSALHFSLDADMNQTGERVTGPMALFASTLYFTTYDPGTVDPYVCSPGNSFLWGVHYIQAGETIDAPSETPGEGPLPQFKDTGSDPPEMVRVMPLTEGGLAFGVGVMQKPSCMTTEDVSDPFLGYGQHKSISSVNPGSFQLIVQLGANQTTDARKVGVDTFDLEPPFAGSTIDAWAAILD